MIINAYKINKTVLPNNNKSNYQITKELIDWVIKNNVKLIEENNHEKIKEEVIDVLYNRYYLNDHKQVVNITKNVIDSIYGYGILQKYIDDENVSDIRVVAYNLIFVKIKGTWKKVKEQFESKNTFEDYVRFCALKNNANITFETPISVFSDRKNALRIEAGIEPVNIYGPSLVIRIHRKNIIANLETLYRKHNMLDKKSYEILKNTVTSEKNIILCGKGGSGKTTLLRALIQRIPNEVAITTNEETAELYLEGRNVIQRECILNRNDDKNIDLEKLSKHSLVMSNDVIIIGELKGAEANAFFDSISTGHVGLATVHADSIRNTIDRLITLIKKSIKAQYYTEDFLRRFLSDSIDYIVFMRDFKVNEIAMIVTNNVTSKIVYKTIYKLGDSDHDNNS